MPTTTLGFPYPAASAAPDVPGDIYALASFLEGFVAQGSWTPAFGGTSAAIGSGGTTGGFVRRIAKEIVYVGWVTFGSGANLGTTTVISGVNSFGTLNTSLSFGRGWYKGGSNPRQLLLTPQSASDYRIWLAGPDPVTTASGIGTPGTGDQIIFRIEGVLA